jgi:hypothetical protein
MNVNSAKAAGNTILANFIDYPKLRKLTYLVPFPFSFPKTTLLPFAASSHQTKRAMSPVGRLRTQV